DPDAAPRHRGMSVLYVEQGAPGFSVSRDIPKLGYRGTESCEVIFDDCFVPEENLLGAEEGIGMKQVLTALEFGRINVAARSVGIAQASLAAAVAYSKERHAFGEPISSFQAIQVKLADMAIDVQAARLLTWWAASILDTGVRADRQSGMAKV